MAEPFLLKKALDVSGSALGKSTSVVAKGLFVLGIIAVVGWSIWVTIIKPHTKWATPSTTQKAEKIDNLNYNIHPSFGGCARIIVQGEKPYRAVERNGGEVKK
jgi:hypothetical protein